METTIKNLSDKASNKGKKCEFELSGEGTDFVYLELTADEEKVVKAWMSLEENDDLYDSSLNYYLNEIGFENLADKIIEQSNYGCRTIVNCCFE